MSSVAPRQLTVFGYAHDMVGFGFGYAGRQSGNPKKIAPLKTPLCGYIA
jgi:hypothetical protein